MNAPGRMLVHQCCAPCSVYPVGRLLDAGVQVYGYFYNPNIHPLSEQEKRMASVDEFNRKSGITFTMDANYGLLPFLEVVSATANRCGSCYAMRMLKVAEFAAGGGFEMFTTTLLYSKYQKHDEIRAVCEAAARQHGVSFYYEDFRAGWQVGIDLSRGMGLYRQKHCGCVFSIADGGLSKSKKQTLTEEAYI